METINHECYVSLEVAELLKQAGFNWYNCNYRYNSNLKLDYNIPGRIYGGDYHCAAPTLDVTQRWLREVKNCYIDVEVFVHNLDKNNVYYTYNWIVYFNNDRYSGSDTETTRYYEVAQEVGIKKALEIILEKVE